MKKKLPNHLIHIFCFIILTSCANYRHEDKSKSSLEETDIISVRNAHSMIYNSENGNTYLFGGANEKEVLSDLWVLDGSNWHKLITTTAPKPRTFASMAYDDTQQKIVLFGGSKVLFGTESSFQNLLNDTWEFKDNKWSKILTQNSPTPRAEAAIVYDENRKRIVLFGGYTIQNDEYIKLEDTWEFYDRNWHLISESGPSGRHGAAMVYDLENKSTILFGGSTVDKQYGEHAGETWSWNGSVWYKKSIQQPSGIFNASMVYDNDKEKLFRFGGWNGKSRINEMWSFKNDIWTKLSTNDKPTPRNHSSMVYDQKEKRIILFGGHDGKYVFGDTWEFSSNKWKKLSASKPKERIENGH